MLNFDILLGCKPLPPCPQDIQVSPRDSTEWKPGKNCKLESVKPKATTPVPTDPFPTNVNPVPTTLKPVPTTLKPVPTTPASDDFDIKEHPEIEADYPPKERWKASATPDQVALVESATGNI